MERLIFHVDVNSAFLSWESMRRVQNGESDLREVPAIVGGDPSSRTSVVLAKSVPAKKYGILTGEPVSMAVRKCPQLIVVPSDFKLYVKCSHAFKAICRDYAPAVEEYSIDECFLDMTGTSRIYPDPVKTAYEIKDKIKNTLGFTVNVGVGSNKMLAKMAGDFEKPDKVHTLFQSEIRQKMWPLPVGDLLLCGKSSAQKLNQSTIRTIGDLAQADLRFIQSLLGMKLGLQLYEYANGIDESPVCPEAEAPKGYSNETTFETDVISYEQADKALMFLADRVAARVRRDGVKGSCISVTIRGNDMKKHSHQKNLLLATDITNEIYHTAKQLFRELWDQKTPLRLIGLALTNLDQGNYTQLSLFMDEKREKEQRADKAVDQIRMKFGKNMIKRGSMLDSDMEAGSKEK